MAKTNDAAPAVDPSAADAQLLALRAELDAAKARAEADGLARLEAEEAAEKAKTSEARMRVELAEARAQLNVAMTELKRRPPLPESLKDAKFIARAKTKINMSGTMIEVGQTLPFDPKNPQPGYEGLEEGVHYELV